MLWTDRFDGFTLEGGPDSFITNKPWAIDLCRRLGLADQLIETDPSHRRSFVVRNGRLVPVPEGFVLMAPHRLSPILTTPILSWRGKLRFLMDLVIPRRDEPSEESLAAFVRRRLGREALDRLVQPLVAGIYTADPNDLSLKATLPQFLAMERDHGSLILAGWRESRRRGGRGLERQASGARYGMFVTLADGMDTLPKALARALPEGTVRINSAVRRITRNEPVSPWLVELLDGPPIEADAVVVATEAHAAARFLDSQDPTLALQLRAIPYASSLIVNVAYRRDQISHPLDGFGAVVPAIEGRPILAVSFLSVKFADRARSGLRSLARLHWWCYPAPASRARRSGDHQPGAARAGRFNWCERRTTVRCALAAILGRCLSTFWDTSIASRPSAATWPSTRGSIWRESPTTEWESPTASTPPR